MTVQDGQAPWKQNTPKKTEGRVDKEPINTCRRWNTGRTAPLPHNPAPEETASGLIRREILRARRETALRWTMAGAPRPVPQMIWFFRILQVVPLGGLAAGQDARKRRFTGRDLKRCAECGGVSSRSPTGANTAQTAPPEFTGGRKQKVNGKEVCCGRLAERESLDLQGSADPQPGRLVSSFAPENGPLTVHKTRYDKHDLYSPAGKGVESPGSQFPF